MKLIKYLIMAVTLLILSAAGIWFAVHDKNLIWKKTIHTDNFGTISVAYPLFREREQVLVFVNTKKIDSQKLSDRIAHLGARAAIIDSGLALKALSTGSEKCVDTKRMADSLNSLIKKIPISGNKHLIVSGIGDGALIPFLNAEATSERKITNLSIGFSAVLPPYLTLCPPFITNHHGQQHLLTTSPSLAGNWRSVWVDHPPPKTAIFVRGIPEAKTWIAPYDTPVDTVLIEELQKLFGQADSPSVPLPVVEVPATGENETVTLFYSGDGGWRDLDRIIANKIAKQGYPVVGIDSLRGFWSRKTPEQATDELTKTLAYYRKAWGAKNFVLAGYSFGADILPPIYNRLTPADQDSVRLLVLLAVSKQAEFEIHVSGWLGKDSGGSPIAPELARLPKNKILCIYGQEEKAETACTDIVNTQAQLLELPGGHHFDEDYPKLTRLILEKYQAVGIHGASVPNHPK
jgi:type IV secretory pathway VirJ component